MGNLSTTWAHAPHSRSQACRGGPTSAQVPEVGSPFPISAARIGSTPKCLGHRSPSGSEDPAVSFHSSQASLRVMLKWLTLTGFQSSYRELKSLRWLVTPTCQTLPGLGVLWVPACSLILRTGITLTQWSTSQDAADVGPLTTEVLWALEWQDSQGEDPRCSCLEVRMNKFLQRPDTDLESLQLVGMFQRMT